jgi:hypothetical protein
MVRNDCVWRRSQRSDILEHKHPGKVSSGEDVHGQSGGGGGQLHPSMGGALARYHSKQDFSRNALK